MKKLIVLCMFPLLILTSCSKSTITEVNAPEQSSDTVNTVITEPSTQKEIPDINKTSSIAFVTAKLDNGEITITYNHDEDSDNYLPKYTEYDVANPVSSFNGSYTDIFCGIIGQDIFPYVFLLTEQGEVEFLCVMDCIMAGMYCSQGMLDGLTDIVSFENGTVDDGFGGGYATVFAIDSKGEKHDISDNTFEREEMLMPKTTETWSVAGITLTIEPDGKISFVSGNGSMDFSGYCKVFYSRENTTCYCYSYWNDSNNESGAFTITKLEDGTAAAVVMSGAELFGQPAGTECILQNANT